MCWAPCIRQRVTAGRISQLQEPLCAAFNLLSQHSELGAPAIRFNGLSGPFTHVVAITFVFSRMSANVRLFVTLCVPAGISPADSNREHTLSTLRYASRAMAIKNSLVRSTMSPGEELAYLRDLVASLQAENGQLKQALSAAGYCVDIALATGAVKDVPGSVQQQGEEQQQQQCRLYVQAC